MKTSETADLYEELCSCENLEIAFKRARRGKTLKPYVFTKTEFLQMLLNKEENYGKMIYRKRLIAFGSENYYLIIKEAIKNGFKG